MQTLLDLLKKQYIGKSFKDNNKDGPSFGEVYTINDIAINHPEDGVCFFRTYEDGTTGVMTINHCGLDTEQSAQSQPKCKPHHHLHRNPRQLSTQFYMGLTK